MEQNRGFTLAEVAVVLVIVALLLAGVIIPLSAQIELRNTSETQRTMEQIKESLIGFALANGRLPCPADGTIAAGAAGAGTEQCANSFGVVPWAALGVPETDAWGRRFSYWVSPIFVDAVGTTFNTAGQSPACTPTPTPVQASFALCSMGNMTVNTRSDGTHAVVALGPALPVVIVSHGKNGYGAYNTAGTLLPAPAAGTDEAANANHSAAASVFYSRTPTPGASGCNDAGAGSFCEFDDIVAMISMPILASRMVGAGKLP
jgi:prepilin-type N-terminal cleavage/methylation domain-containing protein